MLLLRHRPWPCVRWSEKVAWLQGHNYAAILPRGGLHLPGYIAPEILSRTWIWDRYCQQVKNWAFSCFNDGRSGAADAVRTPMLNRQTQSIDRSCKWIYEDHQGSSLQFHHCHLSEDCAKVSLVEFQSTSRVVSVPLKCNSVLHSTRVMSTKMMSIGFGWYHVLIAKDANEHGQKVSIHCQTSSVFFERDSIKNGFLAATSEWTGYSNPQNRRHTWGIVLKL